MPEEKGETVLVDVPIHPLKTREIRPIHNWCEWLAKWQAAETFEQMLGLLHCGFIVSLQKWDRWDPEEKEYDQIDRVCFYLSIADGWKDQFGDLFISPTDSNEKYFVGNYDESGRRKKEELAWELRRDLAQKAFDVLCLNFFRRSLKVDGRHGEEFAQEWEEIITSPRLFSAIQHFFRVEEVRYGGREIVNLSSRPSGLSHNEELAAQFIVNLAEFIWGWREHEVSSWMKAEEKEREKKLNKDIRSRLDSSRPWIVEVLVHLRIYDKLHGWLLQFDEACVSKLTELALDNELKEYGHYPPVVRETRKVGTLDEARFLNSPVAWLLAHRELMLREGKRLRSIVEAEKQVEEAAQKLRELNRNRK